MLLSIVVELEPSQPTEIPADQGAAIYAWALDCVSRSDAALAAAIHDENGPKPLTASDLLGTGARNNGHVRLAPGDRCAIRLTALDAAVAHALVESLVGEDAPRQVDHLSLGGCYLRVAKVCLQANDHPLAAVCSHEELAQRCVLSSTDAPRELRLRFASPTLFRVDGRDVPLPEPALVFGSYLARWNRFSERPLPDDLRDAAESGLSYGRFQIKSAYVPVQQGKKGGYVGFTGDVCFRVRLRDRFYARLLHLLAEYSFWCGTGYRTTVGLGQTRPCHRQ